MKKPVLEDVSPVLKILLLFGFYLFGALLMGMFARQLILQIWQIDLMELDIAKVDPDGADTARYALQLNSGLMQVGMHLLAALSFFQLISPQGVQFAKWDKLPDVRLGAMIKLLGIACLLVGILINNWYEELVSLIPGMNETVKNISAEYNDYQNVLLTGGKSSLILNILLLGFLGPFCEEIFYRAGLLQLLLKTTQKKWFAVVLSAVIFSLLHFEFTGFLVRFLMGLLLGWVFYKTANIWYPIILHVLYNSTGILLEYFYYHDRLNDVRIETLSYISLVLTGLICWYIYKQIKTPHWPIEEISSSNLYKKNLLDTDIEDNKNEKDEID